MIIYKKFISHNKFLYKIMTTIFYILLSSCGYYIDQTKIPNLEQDYCHASIDRTLKIVDPTFSITKSERYTIPNITTKWSGPIIELLPPDYYQQNVNNYK